MDPGLPVLQGKAKRVSSNALIDVLLEFTRELVAAGLQQDRPVRGNLETSMTKMRERVPMWLTLGVWLVSVSVAGAQAGSETFTATASVKTAGGASATAPVTITVDRKMPNAKPKEGYDYAVIDLQLNAKGGGSGVMAPAAKVKPLQGVFVVEDYGAEMVTLNDIKKTQ